MGKPAKLTGSSKSIGVFMIEVVGSAPIASEVVNNTEVARDNLRERVERLTSKDKEWIARICAALSPPLR